MKKTSSAIETKTLLLKFYAPLFKDPILKYGFIWPETKEVVTA